MRRATILAATALAALTACGDADPGDVEDHAPATRAAATLLEPESVATLLASRRGILVLDVRTPAEFAGDHLEGAVNVPIDLLGDAIDEGSFAEPRDRPILVYCARGNRSARAATLLAERGYRDVFDLAGGISAWRRDGLPVTR